MNYFKKIPIFFTGPGYLFSILVLTVKYFKKFLNNNHEKSICNCIDRYSNGSL